MWCVQGCRSAGESSAGGQVPEERGTGTVPAPRGCLLPLLGIPHFPTLPPPLAQGMAAVGALVTNTPLLRKGEGFSTCLSAFLNPGQVLCFSRAQPHSSSSGEDPSCLWRWVCSEQHKHLHGTPPSRRQTPGNRTCQHRKEFCLFVAG